MTAKLWRSGFPVQRNVLTGVAGSAMLPFQKRQKGGWFFTASVRLLGLVSSRLMQLKMMRSIAIPSCRKLKPFLQNMTHWLRPKNLKKCLKNKIAEALAVGWKEKRKELSQMQRSRRFGAAQDLRKSYRVEIEAQKEDTLPQVSPSRTLVPWMQVWQR